MWQILTSPTSESLDLVRSRDSRLEELVQWDIDHSPTRPCFHFLFILHQKSLVQPKLLLSLFRFLTAMPRETEIPEEVFVRPIHEYADSLILHLLWLYKEDVLYEEALRPGYPRSSHPPKPAGSMPKERPPHNRRRRRKTNGLQLKLFDN